MISSRTLLPLQRLPCILHTFGHPINAFTRLPPMPRFHSIFQTQVRELNVGLFVMGSVFMTTDHGHYIGLMFIALSVLDDDD